MQIIYTLVVIGLLVHSSAWSSSSEGEGEHHKTILTLAWGASARIGKRPTMEDFSSASSDGTAFGVFDGHRGAFAAKYAATHLLPALQRMEQGPDYSAVFAELDELIEARDASGTTAITALISLTSYGYRLNLARVGDSYGICSSTHDLGLHHLHQGHLHRPENKFERSRIERAGGNVYLDSTDYTARVACPDTSILGLGVTRALGDRAWPNTSVSPEPYVEHYFLEPERDKFLILATDGIWDYVDQRHAEFIVEQTLETDMEVPDCAAEQDGQPPIENGTDVRVIAAARALRDAAYARGSTDNITALVVKFVWDQHKEVGS
jgi:serine/threonine protein phosphatase PrpC